MTTKIEERFIDFIRRYLILISFFAIALVGLRLRISMFDAQTSDFSFFQKSWIDQLGAYKGISGLAQEIGEYNVPYMLFLAIVSHTPLTDLYEVKAFLVFFDYVAAFASMLLISHIRKTKLFTEENLLVASIFMLSPVIFLESAYWSQCDALYTSLLLFCLYFMVKERHFTAMAFFGAAFAFKLQTVFFLPVILIYYFTTKKMKAFSFLMIPLVYFISVVPALIAGRGLSSVLHIYTNQTSLYDKLTMNCPNLYFFLQGDYNTLKTAGIFMTLGVLGVGAVMMIRRGAMSAKQLLLLSVWCTMVCVFFLPGMHERYFFIVCVFSIIYAFLERKDWWIAAGINIVCLLSWTPYLFQVTVIDLKYLAVANLILLFAVTYRLFFERKEQVLTEN